ncbi:MAG: Asp-tRNA(Asn)/Glu-tRNA(Gln) amidotransferase GatCAB subunit C, partial [Oscillospiraceae bacterium]|nr:Asp-tRNA(Asn)/Glu-tRNA(Gln) amidotransferase GatCAB subunit C [Oscillospiraceae bacterium]
LKRIFKEILDYEVKLPLRRLPYKEALSRFGSDKPDTRFSMELVDLTDSLKDCPFSAFSAAAAFGGSVRAINAKGLADRLTRKEIDRLIEFVKTYRAKGLAYARLTHDGTSSNYEKFLFEEQAAEVRSACDAEIGDVIFIVADKDETVFDSLGALRLEIARKYELIDEDRFDLLWVTEFPLFEYSEEDGRFYAKHHPFTAPMDEDLAGLESGPADCRAKAYDIVVNGVEIGGGSVRISDPALQRRMFGALGFSEEEMTEQFGFLLDAYTFGAPPHCGIAYGLDRLVMLILKKKSIRDVIAFPKVQSAAELMTSSPSAVLDRQLEELHIRHDFSNGE